jgi:hypothetical protein
VKSEAMHESIDRINEFEKIYILKKFEKLIFLIGIQK